MSPVVLNQNMKAEMKLEEVNFLLIPVLFRGAENNKQIQCF